MITISALDADEARAFAERWLPAWTGNDPERLVSFYSPDVYYSDPALPLEDGFLNEWHASNPAGDTVVEIDGVCTVQLRGGLIHRNQVYFDRSALLAALAPAR